MEVHKTYLIGFEKHNLPRGRLCVLRIRNMYAEMREAKIEVCRDGRECVETDGECVEMEGSV